MSQRLTDQDDWQTVYAARTETVLGWVNLDSGEAYWAKTDRVDVAFAKGGSSVGRLTERGLRLDNPLTLWWEAQYLRADRDPPRPGARAIRILRGLLPRSRG